MEEPGIAEIAQLTPTSRVDLGLVDRQPLAKDGIDDERGEQRDPDQAVGGRCSTKSVAPDGSSMTVGSGVLASLNQPR